VPERNVSFECMIIDAQANEQFRAKAIFVKKQPVSTSKRDDKRIELAHIYIYALSDTWKGGGVSFTPSQDGGVHSSSSDENYARRNDRPKDHSHLSCSTSLARVSTSVATGLVPTLRFGRVRRGTSGLSFGRRCRRF